MVEGVGGCYVNNLQKGNDEDDLPISQIILVLFNGREEQTREESGFLYLKSAKLSGVWRE